MDLLNVLAKEDYEKITYYVDEYVNDRRASIQKILTPWAEKKEELYKLLGNNLIIHKPVIVEKEQEEIESELIKNLMVLRDDDGQETFYGKYKRFFDEYFTFTFDPNAFGGSRDLKGVFKDKSDYQIVRCLMDDVEDLSSNRYRGQQITMHFPSGHDYTFTNGTKLFRILKKISDELGIEGYEEYRQLHSQVLNEKSLKGELYLSIHPLDYMTMSDNDCGWSSCMSWEEDGDYRRGTVEMMNSPIVVEAYIPSSVDMLIGKDLTWNSKRWRQLFIVDKQYGVFGIKGYPYWNRRLEKAVLDWLKDLMQENWGVECKEDFYKFSFQKEKNPKAVNSVLPEKTEYCFNTYAMYNDIYSTHYAYLVPTDEEEIDITYSGPSVCMRCGETGQSYDHEGQLVCETCNPVYYCSQCDERIYEDELIEVDGEYYCNYCYDNLPTCDECGDAHNEDNMYQIYLADEEGFLNQSIWLCEDCLNSGRYVSNFNTNGYNKVDHWGLGETLWAVKKEDLTEKGRELFDTDVLYKQRHLTYTDGKYNYHNDDKTVSMKKKDTIWDPEHLRFSATGVIANSVINWTIDDGVSSSIVVVDRTVELTIYHMLKAFFPEVEDKEILDYIENRKDQYRIHTQDESIQTVMEELNRSSELSWLGKYIYF